MRWPWQDDRKQLDRIERKVDQTVTQIGALDALLQQLGPLLTTLDTTVKALIAAIPPGDFAPEVQEVQDALTAIGNITSEVQAATPPPAAGG